VLEGLAPGAVRRIAACGQDAADVAGWVRDELRRGLFSDGTRALSASKLALLPRGVALEALTVMVEDAAGPDAGQTRGQRQAGGMVDRRSLESVLDNALDGSTCEWPIPRGLAFRVGSGIVEVVAAGDLAKTARSRQYEGLWRVPDLPARVESGGTLFRGGRISG
jgi:hypothetical protein